MKNQVSDAAGHPESQEVIFVRRILSWYRPARRPFPWRYSTDPYFVSVCEVLLQRTTAEQVASVVTNLFTRFPTPSDLANAREIEVSAILRPLGLRRRVNQVIRIAECFTALRSNGQEPNFEGLRLLPGIGPYSAAAVSVLTMGGVEPLIDEHVLRIFRRVFDLPALPRRHPSKATREFATRLVPPRAKEYNLGLLDLGRMVCRPRNPRCIECPILDICNHAKWGGDSETKCA